MPLPISRLELRGSPVEQMSIQYQTWYWDASEVILAGELLSSPTVVAYKYDPSYPQSLEDVTSTIIDPATPVVVTDPANIHLNQVQVGVLASTLLPGYSYRVEMTALGDQGSTPAGFFVLRCVV